MRLILSLLAITLLAIAAPAQQGQPAQQPQQPAEQAAAAPAAPAAASTPTLEATAAWLREKFPLFGTFQEGTVGTDEVSNVAFDGCTISFRMASRSSAGTITRDVSFGLADLDPDRTKVEAADGFFVLKLIARNRAKRLKADTSLAVGGPAERRTLFESALNIPIDKMESADRLAKAFNHAAGLCAAQKAKEPF
jgi:hypothetical protein